MQLSPLMILISIHAAASNPLPFHERAFIHAGDSRNGPIIGGGLKRDNDTASSDVELIICSHDYHPAKPWCLAFGANRIWPRILVLHVEGVAA